MEKKTVRITGHQLPGVEGTKHSMQLHEDPKEDMFGYHEGQGVIVTKMLSVAPEGLKIYAMQKRGELKKLGLL